MWSRLLEDAQIKLSVVAADIFGAAGQNLLAALIAGERDPKVLAQLAQGRMRAKLGVLAEALTGHFRAHHGYLLQMMPGRIDALGGQIEQLTGRIEELLAPFAHQVAQLDAVPGVGRIGAQELIAEIGVEMSRFPSAGHLVSWAKFAPTTKASAGKTRVQLHRQGQLLDRRRHRGGGHGSLQDHDLPLGARYRRLVNDEARNAPWSPSATQVLTIAYHLLLDPRPVSPTSAPTSTTACTPNAEPAN